MLFVSLVVALILLAAAIYNVYQSNWPILAVMSIGIACVFAPTCIMMMSPPVFYLSIALTLAAVVCTLPRRRPRLFVGLAVGCFVAIFGVLGWQEWTKLARLQAQFAYESMESRARVPAPGVVLTPTSSRRLETFEFAIESQLIEEANTEKRRIEGLRQLHEHTVAVFVNSSGFGVTRMRGIHEYWLKYGLRDQPPRPQPGPRTTPLHSSGDLHKEVPRLEAGQIAPSLDSMHESGLLDFVNRAGFGLFKDRRHVAGFQEHQMSKAPPSATGWTLETIDLIGLVVHKDPVAYMSDHLPRMDELRKSPVRVLDEFESNGLAALQKGDDLYLRDTLTGRRRVLGAIRSMTQCVECHGGERGALLGAFAYTLNRGPGK